MKGALCDGTRKVAGSKLAICPLRESCQRYHAVPTVKDQWLNAPWRGNQCDCWEKREVKRS